MKEQVSPLVFRVFTNEPIESLKESIRSHSEALLRSLEAHNVNGEIHVEVNRHDSEPDSARVRFDFQSEEARRVSADVIVPWLLQTYKTIELPTPEDHEISPAPSTDGHPDSGTSVMPELEPNVAEPFLSIEALMAAHALLLQDEIKLQNADDPQFLARVKEFINRGTETGTRLSDNDARRTAQSLLNYWVTVLYRLNQESPDAILAYYVPPDEAAFDESGCPYIGLSPFREEDKDSFFGRESLIDSIVERLQHKRLVVLVGPSGSGKTSVLNAGVLPKLKNDAELESYNWVYFATFTPGSEPLANLASVFTDEVQQTAEKLLQQPAHLRELLNDPNFAGKTCVLVIDQFEELFTICKDDTRRKAFLDALFSLRESPIKHRVILLMRSDQVNQLIRREALNEVYREAEVRLYPLKEVELHDVIKKPADRIKLKFEPNLISQLLREIYGDPIGLPLLQFVLLELWAQREGDQITWAAMNRLGSCRDALINKAERLYESFTADEKEVMRRIVLRMVRLSDTWEAATEPVRLEDLYQASDDRGRVNTVLKKLLEANLARISNVSCRSIKGAMDELSADLPAEILPDYQFELVHQSLAHYWPQVSKWLNELRESLVTKRRLELYAANWGILGHGEKGLLDRYQLHEAQTWLESDTAKELGYDADLIPLVKLSRKAINRERLIRWVSWAVAVGVFFVGLIMLMWSEHQRLKTQTSLRLALQADSLKNRELDLSLLLNLEAIQKSDEKGPYKTLIDVLSYSPALGAFLQGEKANWKQVVFGDNGRVYALDVSGKTIQSWDLRSHQKLPEISTPETLHQNPDVAANPRFPLLSPDGRSLIFINKTRALVNWKISTGEQVIYSPQSKKDDLTEPYTIAYSSDSTKIAWLNNLADNIKINGDRELSIWDVSAQKNIAQVLVNQAQNVAFSPDNKTVAVVSLRGDVSLFTAADLKQIGKPLSCSPASGGSVPFAPIVFSGDSLRLAVMCSDTAIGAWNLSDRKPLGPFERGSSGGKVDAYSTVTRLAIDNSGQLLVAGYGDGGIVLWDTVTKKKTEYVNRHRSKVTQITFSPDHQQLITLSEEGGPQLWARSGFFQGELQFQQDLLTGLKSKTSAVAFGPDGLIAGAHEGKVVLWNLAQPSALSNQRLKDVGAPGALTADGHLFVENAQGEIVEFELTTGRELRKFSIERTQDGSNSGIRDKFFAKRSSVMAVRYFDGTIGIWDLRTGKLQRTIQVREGGSLDFSLNQEVAINAQGNTLVVADEGRIRIWAIEGTQQVNIDYRAADHATLALSADGSRLAAFYDRTALESSADGSTSEASEKSGLISVWETATGKPLGTSIHSDPEIGRLEFTNDNTRLISLHGDVLSVWNLASAKSEFSQTMPMLDFVLNPVKDEVAASFPDGSIVFLALADGKEQLRLPATLLRGNQSPLTNLLFSANGESLVAGYFDNSVELISVDPKLFRQRACAIANRKLTQAEVDLYGVFEDRFLNAFKKFLGFKEPLDAGCDSLRVNQ